MTEIRVINHLLRTILSRHWPFLVLLTVSLPVLFWKLGTGSLHDWDEAIYAQISKEFVRSGDWLTPHWGQQLWFEKPPLYMWLTALCYRLFGVDAFWARAASAFAGMGVVLMTFATGKLVHNTRTGLLAGIILLTSMQFVFASRFGTTDVMLTLFTLLAIYGYLRLQEASEQRKWWYLIGASVGLALMTKGAAGAIAPLIVGFAMLLDGQLLRAARSRYAWEGAGIALLLVVPWHCYMTMQHGQRFIDEYIGYHVIARTAKPLEENGGDAFYYFDVLFRHFFPWALLLPFVAAPIVRSIKIKSPTRTLWLAILLPLGLYSIVQTKLFWYITPIYPVLAICVAHFIMRYFERAEISFRIATAIVCVIFVVFGLVNISPLYTEGSAHIARLARDAASADGADRQPLIVFFGISQPTPMFYSDRLILVTDAAGRLGEFTKGHQVRWRADSLGDVIENYRAANAILPRTEVARFSHFYDVRVMSESGPLVYVTIESSNRLSQTQFSATLRLSALDEDSCHVVFVDQLKS